MNQYIEYFTNYVFNNYDIENYLIKLKYFHSIRVARLMVLISNKLNLNSNDTFMAFKLGLCHDLGRFYEVIRNGKFNNLIFDHGAYSNKILYNDKFINYMDINEHLLFRKAIYYHNKKELPDNLNYREQFFANMLRDADKIDILRIRANGNTLNFNEKPTEEVLFNYLNDKMIDIKNIKNSSDKVILFISFLNDLVFNASFDLSEECHCLDDLLKIINVSSSREKEFKKILNKVNERK